MKEVIHDFRPSATRWGWGGLSFYVHENKKTATMIGIGKGVSTGHYIALTQSGIDYAYLVEGIAYDCNPNDMFTATIKISGTIQSD